jgi:hypothetical protein
MVESREEKYGLCSSLQLLPHHGGRDQVLKRHGPSVRVAQCPSRSYRYGWPSVATTRSCHISSDTHRQPPYHNIPRDLEIASPQILILMPSTTIAQAPVLPSDWKIKAVGQVRNFDDDIGVPNGP